MFVGESTVEKKYIYYRGIQTFKKNQVANGLCTAVPSGFFLSGRLRLDYQPLLGK